jgi:hypothetical protein
MRNGDSLFLKLVDNDRRLQCTFGQGAVQGSIKMLR